MRAVASVEAICSRLTRSAKIRTLLLRETANGPSVEKQRCADRTVFLSAGTFLVTCFLLVVVVVALFSLISPPEKTLQSNGDAKLRTMHGSGAHHGMGFTLRLGSRAMHELIVAHVAEQTTAAELKVFLRTLHRSGATARADVVLLFPAKLSKDFSAVMNEEERSFQWLMQSAAAHHVKKNPTEVNTAAQITATFQKPNSIIVAFNSLAFWKSREERRRHRGEILWEDTSTRGKGAMASVQWADWGSIVGFEMQDLDQVEVLEGLIDSPPAQLRRWVCYQMLLGMVKSKYRTVLLAEVGGVLILGDVFSPTRKKSFKSGIFVYVEDRTWNVVHKSRLRNWSSGTTLESDKEHVAAGVLERDIPETVKKICLPRLSSSIGRLLPASVERPEMHFIEEIYGKKVWRSLGEDDKQKPVLTSGFIIGSMRLVRSLSGAMLTEIAARAISRKSREPFHDRALVNHLVQKSSVLGRQVAGKLHFASNSNSSVHCLPGSKQGSVFLRENGQRFDALVGLKDELVTCEASMAISRTILESICSMDSRIYRDCERRS